MAVNTTDIGTVFDSLIGKQVAILDIQYDNNRIDSDVYAKALISLLSSTLQLATTTVEQDALIEAQAAEVLAATIRQNAQSAKDLLLKDEQINMSTAQQATELKKALDIVSTTSVRDAQSAKDLLVKQEQIDMSIAQQATEAKKLLDIVSATAVRDAQSEKDLLVKAEQILEIQEKADLLQSQDLEVLASTTRQNAESTSKIGLMTEQTQSEAKQNELNGVIDKQILDIVAGTTIKTNQAATELKKALDLVSSTSVRNAQSAQDLLNKGQQVTSMIADDNVKAKQVLLIEEQTNSEIKQNQNDGFIDAQIADIKASTDLKSQQELTEAKQTSKLTYEVENILPKQVSKLDEEIDILESQDKEILASTDRQNSESFAKVNLIQEQIESENKQNETDGILDAQKAKIKADTSVVQQKVVGRIQTPV